MNNAGNPTKSVHTTYTVEGNTLVTTTREELTFERDWNMVDPTGVVGVAVIRVGQRRFVSRYWRQAGGEREYQSLNPARSKSEANLFFEDLKRGSEEMAADLVRRLGDGS